VHLMVSAPEGTRGLPDGARAGASCRRAVSLQDIYPTLIDLCGLPARNDIAGRSLVPLLCDPEKPWPHPAITSVFTGELAVGWEQWRYIRYLDGGEELYDLDRDPHEWTNLADHPDYRTVKSQLAGMLPADPALPVVQKEK